MSQPPFRKWRPHWPMFYRQRGIGWQVFFHIHPDHNPILVLMKWAGVWHFEFYERFIWRSDTGWRVHPRFDRH